MPGGGSGRHDWPRGLDLEVLKDLQIQDIGLGIVPLCGPCAGGIDFGRCGRLGFRDPEVNSPTCLQTSPKTSLRRSKTTPRQLGIV